jgi:hypothetical protein
MLVLIFSTTFIWNISYSTENWAVYDQKYMNVGLHVKYLLFLSDFNETWIFLTDFLTMFKYQISTRDIRTDTTKLIVAFRNFVNAPKNPLAYL